MKKEGNKKMPTPRQKVIHNPIPTSLFLSSPYPFYVGIVHIMLFCIVFSLYSNSFEHNKDVGMGL